MPSEADIQRDIQKYIESLGGKVIKTQGIVVGTPDLIGAVPSKVYQGVSFAIEVKTPETIGDVPPKQRWELSQWAKLGWVTFVATSVEDVKANFKVRGII